GSGQNPQDPFGSSGGLGPVHRDHAGRSGRAIGFGVGATRASGWVEPKGVAWVLRVRQQAQPSSRVSATVAELVRIERYERRAMSRRKGLFRALDALRWGSSNP